MHLISLKTQNFKRLGTFSCEFTSGSNVIAGDNARGKSTLLQAIEVALFGAGCVPGKKEHIPTWGQNKYSVELRFQIGPDIFVATRTGTTARLWAYSQPDNTERLVANGSTPVTAAIEELLGMSGKDWNLFIQSKQHSAAAVLEFGATALNRKVEEFAGVEVIDKVQSAAQRRALELNASANAKKVDDDDLDLYAMRLKDAQTDVEFFTDQVKAATVILDLHGVFDPSGPSSDELDAMRQAARQADQLWAKLSSAEELLAELADQEKVAVERAAGISQMDAAAAQKELDELKEAGQDLRNAVDEARRMCSKHGAMCDASRNAGIRIDQLNKESAALGYETSSEGELIEAVETSKTALEKEVGVHAEHTATVKNLNQLAAGAQCPTCGHMKEDHDPVKLGDEIKQAESAAADAQVRVESARGLLKAAETGLKAFRSREEQRASINLAISNAEAVIDEFTSISDEVLLWEETMPKLEQELEISRNRYSSKLAALDSIKEHNARFEREQAAARAASAKRTEKADELAALNKKWEELPEPPTEEDIADAEQQFKENAAAHDTWKATHASINGTLAEVKASLAAAEKACERAEQDHQALLARNATAAEESALAARYSRLARFLADRRQAYLKEVWDAITLVASRLVRDASRGEITQVTNDGGDFYFEENGVLAPTSSASGAQKAFIGTSLRIGLSRALYGRDSLMLFDEPTESCTEENAAAMAGMLSTSAKQTLLITHRETDQQLAVNIINVGEG